MVPPPVSDAVDPAIGAGDPDAALGVAVREALGERRPWVAVQTSFSALHGTVAPGRWAAALAAYAGGARAAGRDRRGANHPAHGAAVARSVRASAEALARFAREAGGGMVATLAPPVAPAAAVAEAEHDEAPWAALADVGDLAGLPACLEAWGHGRLAVGATVPLSAARGMPPALLLAPEVAGYRALCRLLSWHHEEPAAWAAWLAGDDGAVGERGGERCPPWAGVVALVQDPGWARRLAAVGAEVCWRLPGPPVPAGIAVDVPAVALPILTDLDGGGAGVARLMHLIQDRSEVRAQVEAVRARPAACTLAALPRLMDGVDDDAIARGHALARRCRFAPGRPGPDGQPPWQMPPSRWGDADAELRRLCALGLHDRYGGAEARAVRDRLAHELAVIARKGFASYILTVLALARGRRTCGRGSAASSLVCYVLGLTNVDPVKYRLVFERFLSDERRDPPDIDIDFPWDERDKVLQAAIDEYGRAHVAMVATHQRLHAAGALREAGRALGRGRAEITALRRRLRVRRRRGAGADDEDPEAGADDDEWGEVLAAAEGLEGMLRGSGLHCGGLVITPGPIREAVPIHPAAKTIGAQAVPAIAWEKDGAEAMGLVKIDLLGNRSLAVVRDVVADLKDEGIVIDLWRWAPDEDLLAHQLIARGRTIGCFYIESPAMRQLNDRAGAVDFDRLVLHSSIIRPAAYRWIGAYLERLHEFRATGVERDEWYPHPALRALLSESFGVISYQEDVMLAARDLAGFAVRDQDRLRKALGRSDTPQRLAGLAGAFHAGCAARSVAPEVATLVWDMILSFAGYSFCKAHSASYAMVSYACASLKAHWPAHFLARVIHNRGGFYALSAYVEEARRMGVRILGPCCAQGHGDTRAATARALRIGLDLVHGLRARTIACVLAERERRPFAGIHDLWRRCRLTTAELEVLLDAGALDALAPDVSAGQRRRLVALAVAAGHAPEADDDAERQTRWDFAADTVPDPVPAAGPEPSQGELDRRAWAALGCLPRAHPFAMWRLPARRLRVRDITPALDRQQVVLIAWVITRKQVEAVQEHGHDGRKLPEPDIRPMAFATLEDEDAVLESTWFPAVYRACAALIDCGLPLRIAGRVAVEYSVASLEVTAAAPAVAEGGE
jgi:DNA polymerase-3 subunit alpha/error-prone DNA polymerase